MRDIPSTASARYICMYIRMNPGWVTLVGLESQPDFCCEGLVIRGDVAVVANVNPEGVTYPRQGRKPLLYCGKERNPAGVALLTCIMMVYCQGYLCL